MTRYLIERAWDPIEEDEMSSKGPLSKKILEENERFWSRQSKKSGGDAV